MKFNSIDLIPKRDYYLLDYALNQFENIKLTFSGFDSIQNTILYNDSPFGLTPKVDIIDFLKTHVNLYISDLVRKKFESNKISEFIYLEDKSDLNSVIFNLFLDFNPKCVYLPPGHILYSISSSNEIKYDPPLLNSNTNTVGSFNGVKIESDPFLKDKEVIHIFNSININIENAEIIEDKLQFQLDFKIEGLRSIAIVDGPESKHWTEIVKMNRNSKLNSIIK
jgi:hypothetical protein